MTPALVSICMPCFNAGAFVGAAIECVLGQAYPNIELVVVDDGSTDDSRAVIGRFLDRGIRLITQEVGSAAAARNRALTASTGEFVLFLDADDLISQDHVARLVSQIPKGKHYVAMGEWDRFSLDPNEARFPKRPGNCNSTGTDWLIRDWSNGAPMTQCGTFLIPRALIYLAGPWDERLTLIDDFEFFARILSTAEGIIFVQGARLYYRSGFSGNLSGRTSRRAAESAALSLRLGTDYLLSVENSVRARKASANMLRTFDHCFYPAFPDLSRLLEARIDELGGSDLQPVGPPAFQILRRWIGWRVARRIQRLAERFGLNRAARQKKFI